VTSAKKRRVVLARRALTVPSGSTRLVGARLTTAGRQLLADRRRVRVTRRIAVRLGDGSPVVGTRSVVLKRAPRKSRS
jgi:hypothetical protein